MTTESKIIEADFSNLGGTWDMVGTDKGLEGSGSLDDKRFLQLEYEAKLFERYTNKPVFGKDLVKAEEDLSRIIFLHMRIQRPEPQRAEEIFKSWCPDFGNYVTAPFTAYYSGDSSHLRSSLNAPIISIMLMKAHMNPNRPYLAAQGTDTADISLISPLDVLTFDTNLPPFIFTGSNKSWREGTPESPSNAPQNFTDLARLCSIDLPAGAYWNFQGYLYRAPDLIKTDPEETRRIEGMSTFFAPRQKATRVETLLELSRPANWGNRAVPPTDHVLNTNNASMLSIYEAMNQVQTVDLGDQNPVWEEVDKIIYSRSRAVIIAAHGLGNVNNIIRDAALEATLNGKLVFDVSRCLIGNVNERYAGSLLDTNNLLPNNNHQIISAGQLNKSAIHAIAVRAIMENMDQKETQLLLDKYHRSRLGSGVIPV